MIMRILCSIVAFICLPSPLNANAVGWPGLLFLSNYFQNSNVFFISIIAGLIIEFIVLRLFFSQENFFKLAGITLLMNIVSATIGFVFASLLELLNIFAIGSLIPRLPDYDTRLIILNILNIFIATVLANTILEFLIARIFLRPLSNKRLFFALMFANSLSFLIDVTTMLLILKRVF